MGEQEGDNEQREETMMVESQSLLPKNVVGKAETTTSTTVRLWKNKTRRTVTSKQNMYTRSIAADGHKKWYRGADGVWLWFTHSVESWLRRAEGRRGSLDSENCLFVLRVCVPVGSAWAGYRNAQMGKLMLKVRLGICLVYSWHYVPLLLLFSMFFVCCGWLFRDFVAAAHLNRIIWWHNGVKWWIRCILIKVQWFFFLLARVSARGVGRRLTVLMRNSSAYNTLFLDESKRGRRGWWWG